VRIVGAECAVYRWNLPRAIGDANGVADHLDVAITAVTTDGGHTGYALGGSQAATSQVAGLLDGADPHETRGLARLLRGTAFKEGIGGSRWQAAIALENALWDLKGKLVDLPLWRLLGAQQGKVPVYASALGAGLGVDDLYAVYRGFAERGMRIAKIKVGANDAESELLRIEAVVAAVADAGGTVCGLMVDINEHLTTKAATSLANRIHRHYPMLWVEEPAARSNIGELRWARDHLDSNLATGENLTSARELLQVMSVGACDVIQLGGHLAISDAVTVSEVAAAVGVPASVVSGEGHALAHVAAATGHAAPYEIKFLEPPPFLEVGHTIEGGCLHLADLPGVGFRTTSDATAFRAGPHPDETFPEGPHYQTGPKLQTP
jgi:L-alanine-DL-glutamate epimerase-like enolase superfamily enzyme